MRPLRIALVSESASPLAPPGGVGADPLGVHVAALSRALARRGHQVTVHTRREDTGLGEHVPLCPGVLVHHVGGGPARGASEEKVLRHMAAFGEQLADYWIHHPPTVAHAHFWTSGLVGLPGAHYLGIPLVQTFHALAGAAAGGHRDGGGISVSGRIAIETAVGQQADRVLSTCRDELDGLRAMGVPEERIRIVPPDGDRAEPRRPRTPARHTWHRAAWNRAAVLTELVYREALSGPPFDRAAEDVRGGRSASVRR
ncbi:glycosyltransferase [Kitasatospora purpeofusca]|uniref:glycosyltransferase n=1 Tax=Kitasatospora purpeofusca TaxID=67352 RepID=UPI002A5A3F98|nr:glycosyltransferase [Kitasatospora purpeofusca]MDY0814525.1 glycosyltransferase [Kitasatospora purpeofusca]